MTDESAVPSAASAVPTAASAVPTSIAGCVIAFDEADRIEDCVRSLLSICAQVLVLDSGSRDGTRELAAACGAEVHLQVPFLGHREQKQRAVELARHDWVLCLDADERVTEALRAQIAALREGGLSDGGPAGFEVPRHNHYLGRVVRRGLFWPDHKLRLFDRRRGRWGGVNPHDRVELDPGQRSARLTGAIEHLSYRDFAHHLRTIDSFTAISARALRATGRQGTLLDLLVRPPAVFVKSLVLKRGFVDGWRGLLIAAMAFYYDWLKYWRLWRLR